MTKKMPDELLVAIDDLRGKLDLLEEQLLRSLGWEYKMLNSVWYWRRVEDEDGSSVYVSRAAALNLARSEIEAAQVEYFLDKF